jgi:hypothetical protein
MQKVGTNLGPKLGLKMRLFEFFLEQRQSNHREFGGADGIRTHDLLDAIEARSQLRHGPTVSRILVYHSWPRSLVSFERLRGVVQMFGQAYRTAEWPRRQEAEHPWCLRAENHQRGRRVDMPPER